MSQRTLYIAAYDICDPLRLTRGLAVLRDYSTGGQKSVFECFLTKVEKKELCRRMRSVLDTREDRFLLISPSSRRSPRVLGLGVIPRQPKFYYIG